MTGFEAAGRYFHKRWHEEGLDIDDADIGIMELLCRELVDWDQELDLISQSEKGRQMMAFQDLFNSEPQGKA